MTQLTAEQLTFARVRLALRAKALRGEIGAVLHQGNGDEPALPNRYLEADNAVADVETDLEVASLSRDARELTEVTEALARLDRGGYGQCIACGKAIGWERLAAQPQAARCLRCENGLEAVTGGLR